MTDTAPLPEQMRFDGRVALVTGAGRGMGREHARCLAERGATVVVSDLGTGTEGSGADHAVAPACADEIVSAGGTASAHCADLSSEEGARGAVRHALADHGRLDIIIHNAGFSRSVPFAESRIEDLDDLYAINTRAAALLVSEAWPVMAEQRHGRIVFVGSTAMYGMSDAVYYATVKASYLGLARSLAEAGRDLGIAVNLIGPSAVSRLADTLEASEFKSWFFDTMRPELVTALVAYLAHEDATVSGESFAVAGGRVARILMGETEGIVDRSLSPEAVRDAMSAIVGDTAFEAFPDYVSSAQKLMQQLGYNPSEPLAPLKYVDRDASGKE